MVTYSFGMGHHLPWGCSVHESTGPNFVGFNNDFGVEDAVSEGDDLETYGIVQSNNEYCINMLPLGEQLLCISQSCLGSA